MLRIGLIGLSWLVNLVPLRVAYVFGDALGWAWYYLFPFRHKVVLENLRKAFASGLSEEELHRLCRANFLHYGRLIVEMVASIRWKTEDYRRNIVVTGLEHARACQTSQTGAFFLTCHLGPFELLPGVAAAYDLPLDIVVKHARNRTAEKFLQWYRGRLGVKVLLESGTAKDILRSLGRQRFVGFVFDQFMGPPIGLPVTFFGQEAGTAVAVALLTEKRDVPVLPVYAYRDAHAKLHVVVEPKVEYPGLSLEKDQRLYDKTQHLNDVLERIVRAHPEQWLWLHRRWKPYLGEPRWKMKNAIVLFAFSILLANPICRPAFAEEPGTGIKIAADPPITMPKFKSSDEDGDETPRVTPKAEVPVEEKAVTSKKKAKARKGKGKKGKEAALAPIPDPIPVFDVIPSDRIPFDIGERMEMQLSWIGINAGTATLEVRNGPVINGRSTFEFWAQVLSSKLVDAIYHVDNIVQTYVDKAALIPYKFLLHMIEKQQLKETRVVFDHPKKKALYWSQRISKKWGDEVVDRADEFVPQAKDMWSAVYYSRTLNYKLNQKQTFTIYENGKNWEVELLPIANELLNTKVGVFQCWKLLVVVKLNNILRPTGDIFMWISDDAKHYIVKFDAKIKIGSLQGNILSIRDRQ